MSKLQTRSSSSSTVWRGLALQLLHGDPNLCREQQLLQWWPKLLWTSAEQNRCRFSVDGRRPPQGQTVQPLTFAYFKLKMFLCLLVFFNRMQLEIQWDSITSVWCSNYCAHDTTMPGSVRSCFVWECWDRCTTWFWISFIQCKADKQHYIPSLWKEIRWYLWHFIRTI